MNLKRFTFLTFLFVLYEIQYSCAHISGHENFMETMQSFVGKNADDPYIWFNYYSSRRGPRKVLPNGNIEQAWLMTPGCEVYFEIDRASQKIVSWRYEGTDEKCRIQM